MLPAHEFERLTSYDARGRLAPRVAARWSPSADGLIWRITLDEHVRFRDGSPVTADLVGKAIDALARAEATGATYVCLGDIAGVDVDGARDIVIRMARPCAYVVDELDIEVAWTTPDGERIGTGPYREVARQPGRVEYEANRAYHGGTPAIDRVGLRAYSTLREAWADMMRGQVDVLMDVRPDGVDFLRDQTGIQTWQSVSLNAIAIGLNAKRAVFAEPDVRRALSLAVDRAELVTQALGGRGLPEDVPIWPGYWALDRTQAPVPFDPGAARRLLGNRRMVFTCLVPEGFALWEKIALLVQRQLRSVGVDMRLVSVTLTELFARLPAGNFDAVVFDPLGGPHASIQHMFWHSPEPMPRQNIFGYRSATVDAALDTMRGALDEQSFRAAVAQFVAAIRHDPPAIFLVRETRTQAVSRRFTLPPDTTGTDILRTITRWTLSGGGT